VRQYCCYSFLDYVDLVDRVDFMDVLDLVDMVCGESFLAVKLSRENEF